MGERGPCGLQRLLGEADWDEEAVRDDLQGYVVEHLGFAFPEDIRKVIYTTNTIESLNMTLRNMTHNRRIFPSDESVFKVMHLAVQAVSKKWTMPIREGKPALNRFAIEFAERFPQRKTQLPQNT